MCDMHTYIHTFIHFDTKTVYGFHLSDVKMATKDPKMAKNFQFSYKFILFILLMIWVLGKIQNGH